jgi:Predicted divalent heavy-metal cations transporter
MSLIISLCDICLSQTTSEDPDKQNWSKAQTWVYGILTALGTSSTGFIMSMLFLPLMKWKWVTQNRLSAIINVMIAFSMGSAIGDTFFQIMPTVYIHDPLSGEKPPDRNIVSVIIISSFIVFVLIDRVFSAMEDAKNGHHSHGQVILPNRDPQQPQEQSANSGTVVAEVEIEEKKDQIDNKNEKCFDFYCGIKGRKRIGIMILLSDLFHNITDGLAIGSAFASRKRHLAISTLLAVFAHEIPQEISDMGILVHANFPPKQAIVCNGMINCSALIGAVIGLAVGNLSEIANAYLFSFVGGNFIYISAVQLMPVVLEEKRNGVAFGMLFSFIGSAAIQYALTGLQ